MKLTNEVRIARPPDEVFAALLDGERVAGCVPGSRLTRKTGENTYAGEVTVRVGPISAAYSGTVRYLELNRPSGDSAGRIVFRASAREKSGQGDADARVTVTVSPDTVSQDSGGAYLSIDADLMIRGQVAQFGPGVIGELSQQLISRFAQNVEQVLAAQAAQAGGQPRPARHQAPPPEKRAPDAAGLTLRPVLKRIAPVAAGLTVALLIGIRVRRNSRSRP
jgi:carbon monoxide dehydrogenase subunit G